MSGGFRKKFGGGAKGEDIKVEVDSSSAEPASQAAAEEVQNEEARETELLELKKALEAVEEQKKDLERKLALAVAEGRNIVARSESSMAQFRRYAISEFVKDVSDPMETLLLVYNHTPDDAALEESAKQAMDMVIQKFFGIFSKHGVARIYPEIGANFDHNFHQAISMEKVAEQAPGLIVRVVKAGYSLHDRVLLPAIVIVTGE